MISALSGETPETGVSFQILGVNVWYSHRVVYPSKRPTYVAKLPSSSAFLKRPLQHSHMKPRQVYASWTATSEH